MEDLGSDYPKVLKECKTCGKETTHILRDMGTSKMVICLPCLRKAITYEQGRD